MLIVFIVLQILLDIYFFWFIILANTAIGILYDNNPRLTTLAVINKIQEKLEEENKNEKWINRIRKIYFSNKR